MQYAFNAAFVSCDKKFAFTSAGKPLLFGFRYVSAADSIYPLKYAAKSLCYKLSLAHRRGRGLWRFSNKFRDELFYENPTHSFMYARRELDYTNNIYSFMYQTRISENSFLNMLLARIGGSLHTHDTVLTQRLKLDADSNRGIRLERAYSQVTCSISEQLFDKNAQPCADGCEVKLDLFDARTHQNSQHDYFGDRLSIKALLSCDYFIFFDNRNLDLCINSFQLDKLSKEKCSYLNTNQVLASGAQKMTHITNAISFLAANCNLISQLCPLSEQTLEANLKDTNFSSDVCALREVLRRALDNDPGFYAFKEYRNTAIAFSKNSFVKLRKDSWQNRAAEKTFMKLRRNLKLKDIMDFAVVKISKNLCGEEIDIQAIKDDYKDALKWENLTALLKSGIKHLDVSVLDSLTDENDMEALAPLLLFYLDREGEKKQLILVSERSADCERTPQLTLSQPDTSLSQNLRETNLEREIAALIKRFRNACSGGTVLLTPETAFFIAETYNVANKQRILSVIIENERRLALWKRLWFLAAEGDTDRLILPCRDYPYDTEPIGFVGFDDLIPDNYNVVFPNTFWKGVYSHPLPDGALLGSREIPLAINIMVEMINILILMWCRFYRAFWGWTGTQAVLGITSEILCLLTLDASRAEQFLKGSGEHYDRCFRWLRWEAEKVALSARNDMELRGNFYVGVLLEELISYMLDHHFDVMPVFRDIQHMDNWRRLFGSNLQHDISWTLDKVKGIRHKLIEGGKI